MDENREKIKSLMEQIKEKLPDSEFKIIFKKDDTQLVHNKIEDTTASIISMDGDPVIFFHNPKLPTVVFAIEKIGTGLDSQVVTIKIERGTGLLAEKGSQKMPYPDYLDSDYFYTNISSLDKNKELKPEEYANYDGEH